ncbi:Hypothetical cyanobacterial membrane protein, in cluster with PxcA [Richelia intracellularis HM01]|uniref:hypothetical protein n=1 Tax=Richelia intracellularis TaxID=1164990 RepID=UPI0002B4F593|nr:hypothetical protein [Richelia intracellularis]CCH65469.1 Hypothetical cyanobacterial membrane protein, in cluster with PxcA [Richelia intracellularis HM01]
MISESIWIVGPSQSGKTTRLIKQFYVWIQNKYYALENLYTGENEHNSKNHINHCLDIKQTSAKFLVLAANNENRRRLSDKVINDTYGKYPVRCQTPLGFIQDEVILFWPLLVKSLDLKAQFPVLLRPETEQKLAAKLWHKSLDIETQGYKGMGEYRLVRRLLDCLQLAAYAAVACEDITTILTSALIVEGNNLNLEPEFIAFLLLNWRDWCLERGFLTYGIVTELYGQHLLQDSQYQQQLHKRYQGLLADDVQDYPAITRHLFEFLLDNNVASVFTYNADSIVRLGLGADPCYMEGLASRCQQKILIESSKNNMANILATPMMKLVTESMTLSQLPPIVKTIQTTSRAQLLRQTAETIAEAIKTRNVQPKEIAIIAPGLDAIARYTLIEILNKQGITVETLHDKRPLISSPLVRALLTIISFVYPGLGRLVDRDKVAEMLVLLSGNEEKRTKDEKNTVSSQLPKIDLVRAGLLADYCFVPHIERPDLLPARTFKRWDRLGYTATKAYSEILAWLKEQRSQQELSLIPNPVFFLDKAIQHFFGNDGSLQYHQIAALRELIETAQHYWDIDIRLGKSQTLNDNHQMANTIAEFIQLLRQGCITANPHPVSTLGHLSNAVILATIFQYRSSRRSHPWHFWLDTGSQLWAKGGAATLFGANYFLHNRLGKSWTAEDEQLAENQRLRRILSDLLARVSTRVYLCHSKLAINGQEQIGPLLPLVNACISL